MIEVSPEQSEIRSGEDATPASPWRSGSEIVAAVRRILMGEDEENLSLIRAFSHIALLVVVLGLVLVGRLDLPDWQITQPVLLTTPLPTATPQTLSELIGNRGGTTINSGPLTRSAVPFTTIPERPREDILLYRVQPGDTVFGIAEKFGLKPESIQWANEDLELNPDLLRVNDELVILPVDGVYHKVKKGDTLSKIARRYKVKPADIVNYPWNKLSSVDDVLEPGRYLIVPGGEKPFIPRTVSIYKGKIPEGARRGTGNFVWPVSGTITQPFWRGHRALDIGSWYGSPVVASDSGYVVYAGWDNSGYGNLIIIDHGNGYRTYYAHLSKILVRRGESVARGQRIGSVGSTGNSTGPHLHFEIRLNNVLRNPIGFLK